MYTELGNSEQVVQFWSKLLNAKYDKCTRKLTLEDGTMWLGGRGFPCSSLYVREDYERLWSKICWGMSFSDDAVEGLHIPDDDDKEDLLTYRQRTGESFRGYIVNGIPGGFLSSFCLAGSQANSLQSVQVSASRTLAFTFFGDCVAKVLLRSCGMVVMTGLFFIQMVVFTSARLTQCTSTTLRIGFL